MVENTVGKGEIAHYEQFLLFPECFHKACFPEASKGVTVWEFDENGRKLSKPVENTVGKGEIARYKQFLLSQQCFQKACFKRASKGVIVWVWVKFLRIDTMLDLSKVKAYVDDKINVTKNTNMFL